MIRYLFIPILLLISFSLKAQSANFKNKTIKANYVQLPSNPISDTSKRTYSINIQNSSIPEQAFSVNSIRNAIVLYGFEKVNQNGFLQIHVQINDVIIEKVEYVKSEEVEKDKDGNVTSSKSFFTPVIFYSATAAYEIVDPNGKSEKFNLGGSEELRAKFKYETKKKAEEYISNNLTELKNSFYNDLADQLKSRISYKLNDIYGYQSVAPNVNMEVLNSKKHPEFENHQKNYLQVEALFQTMETSLPITTLIEKTKPVIEYYESLINKYTDPKKSKEKKIRFASYFNIAQLYYYLDRPDESISYATKLVENGVSKGKGKRLIEKANELKTRLAANQVNSRHFEVITTDITTQEPVSQKDQVEAIIEIDKRFTLTDNIEADNEILQKTARILIDYLVVGSSFVASYPLITDTIKDEKTGRIIELKALEPDNDEAYKNVKIQYEGNKLNAIEISDVELLLSLENGSLIHIGEKNNEINCSVNITNNGNTIIFKNVKIPYNRVVMHELNYIDGKISSGKAFSQNGKLWEDVLFSYDNNKITYKRMNPKIESRRKIISVERISKSELKTEYTSIDSESTSEKSFFFREDGQVNATSSHGFFPWEQKLDIEKTFEEDKVIKEVSLKYTKDGLIEKTLKTIKNIVDLPKTSNNLEDFEWRRGMYEFNGNDELIYESRDMKYRKKENGIWSSWKYIRY